MKYVCSCGTFLSSRSFGWRNVGFILVFHVFHELFRIRSKNISGTTRDVPRKLQLYGHKAMEANTDSIQTKHMLTLRKCRHARYKVLVSGLTFAIFWGPYFITSVVNVVFGMLLYKSIEEGLIWFGTFQSILNPIIYILLNRKISDLVKVKIEAFRQRRPAVHSSNYLPDNA